MPLFSWLQLAESLEITSNCVSVGAQYTVLPNLAQLEEATQSRSGENCIFRPIAAGLLDFQSEGVL